MFFKILKFTTAFFIVFFAIFLVLDAMFPLNLDALNKSQSKIVYDKNGEILRIKLSDDGALRFYTSNIPEILKNSVILFEDRYFYYHFGINPLSIIRATFHNLKSQNRIGASTITMQVARMLGQNERSYKNKIKEIFIALQLEWRFSKDEILKFYFNLAPYGGNIEGVKAASLSYFGREPNELSYAQMALLSTIPKNPNKNRLDRKSDINRLKNRVIKMLYKANIIDKSAFKRAQDEPFFNVKKALPYHAPEFSDVALKNGLEKTNLNLNLQNQLNIVLKNAMLDLKDKNANNAAAVVIDNSKMSVVAFVGSHDQSSKDGKNSALNMKRNVGSTPKPFVFSLALDNGLITPKTELVDTQIALNEYVPKNFNDGFLGVISAADALRFSLNIPVISLNTKLGQNSLYELLQTANLVEYKKEYYGASIVLGSSEMSLLNLAHLYTIYANNGILKPLEFAGELVNKQTKDISLISEQSAFLTAKILSQANRAYLGNAWQYAKNTPKIAFKTGTSYGSRDIYAVGINKDYTIAVWIGNFNAQKTIGLTGLKDASKIIFDMFKLISLNQNLSFIAKPDGIVTKPTCLDAFSLKECKNLQDDEQILGVALKDSCEYIRTEELDFMLKNEILTKEELEQSPCKDILKNKKPVFFSPYSNQTILVSDEISKIMLKCHAYLGDKIYYKVDDSDFIKVQNGSENIVNLALGKHQLKCLDENSNLTEIEITLRR
ncbi:penicillin-binding protein 1C [Campylobacter mucosalis]|uniref:penicillin-binding protein 1C n=1 Tax=Campylobacter mucosalis TaxID=202 RepID=UPI0014704292|nr:penicillin-binding protein 1C [Campylobacter mucosalis]